MGGEKKKENSLDNHEDKCIGNCNEINDATVLCDKKNYFENFFTLEIQKQLISRAQCFGSNFEDTLLSYAKIFFAEFHIAIAMCDSNEWLTSHDDIVKMYVQKYYYKVNDKPAKKANNKPQFAGNKCLQMSEMMEVFHKVLTSYHKWVSFDGVTAVKYIREIIAIDDKKDILNSKRFESKYVLTVGGSDKLYRGRISNSKLQKNDMFHIPFKEACKIKNQRFSLTGQPLLYLANSVEGVAYELGESLNDENAWADFYVSQYARNKDNKKMFSLYNLKIPTDITEVMEIMQNIKNIDDFRKFVNRFILSCICSFPAMSKDGYFVEEYVIPQIVTQIIKQQGYDGLCYVSANINVRNNYSNYVFFTNKSYVEAAVDEELRTRFEISNPVTGKYIGGLDKNNRDAEDVIGCIQGYFKKINRQNQRTLERISKLEKNVQAEYKEVFGFGIRKYYEVEYDKKTKENKDEKA